MIKPTVGRVVWYHPQEPVDQPQAAVIAYVWNESLVNLAVFDANGVVSSETSVLLFHGEGERPQTRSYCEWMPYQLGQAAKTEAAEKQLEEKSIEPSGEKMERFDKSYGAYLVAAGTVMKKRPNPVYMEKRDEAFEVETNEGVMTGKPGDFIAHDPISGHVWPVSADYVAQHYDPVLRP